VDHYETWSIDTLEHRSGSEYALYFNSVCSEPEVKSDLLDFADDRMQSLGVVLVAPSFISFKFFPSTRSACHLNVFFCNQTLAAH
jgi:hypothetical protein